MIAQTANAKNLDCRVFLIKSLKNNSSHENAEMNEARLWEI